MKQILEHYAESNCLTLKCLDLGNKFVSQNIFGNFRLNNTAESCNNLTIRSWMLDVAQLHGKERLNNILSRSEIKRQEAIYELYCGENVLLNELYILKNFYYEPMLSTEIFTSEELFILFGDLTNLIEIHRNLRDELLKLRDKSGFTKTVGPTLLIWVSFFFINMFHKYILYLIL